MRPTKHPLDCHPQEPFWIEDRSLRLACYRQSQNACLSNSPANLRSTHRAVELLIIKFLGNAGRAERSPIHPANVWPNRSIEVWSINPPGYGESPGRASLDNIPAIATAVWQAAESRHPATPVLVYGNSIGSLTAMRMVAHARQHRPANRLGLLLRNPPDLLPLIREHRRRWYHGPVPHWLTSPWTIPTKQDAVANRTTGILEQHLDSVALASDCQCPLLLIQAERDRMVPPANQDRIFAAYPGPKAKFIIPQADHHQAPTPDDEALYGRYIAAIQEAFSDLMT